MHCFGSNRGSHSYESRAYLAEKLQRVEHMMKLNRSAEQTLVKCIDETQLLIQQIDDVLEKFVTGQKKSNVEFYTYFFETFKYSSLLRAFKQLNASGRSRRRYPDGDVVELGEPSVHSENSFDDFSVKEEGDSEFEWNISHKELEKCRRTGRMPDEEGVDESDPFSQRPAMTRKWMGEPVEPKPKTKRKPRKPEPLTLAQELLRPNLDKIIENYGIDILDLQDLDFKGLVGKLNTIEFVTKTMCQITVADIYILFRRRKRPGKVELNEFEKNTLISLISKCDFINFRGIYSGLKSRIPAFGETDLNFLHNFKNWKCDDDELLVIGIMAFGMRWSELSFNIFEFKVKDLQCRERFANMIDPTLQGRIAPFDSLKKELIKIFLFRSQDVGWSTITKRGIPYRTDNEIFRFYSTYRHNNPEQAAELESICKMVTANSLDRVFRVTR